MLRNGVSFIGFLFFSLFAASAFSASVQYQLPLTSSATTFDPAKSFDTDSSTMIVQIFDPLFIRTPGGTLSPALAEGYEVSPDRSTYRIRLKKGVTFHNGKPILARDVVASVERVIRIAKLGGRDLDPIRGVDEFRAEKTKKVSGIEIADDRTVVFRLKSPVPLFPFILANLTFSIVPEDFEKLLATGVVVGSGAYQLQGKTAKAEMYRLTKFPKYWDPNVAIDEILYRVVTSEAQARQFAEEGKLDNTHPYEKLSFPDSPAWRKYEFLHTSVRYLGFNASHPTFKDVGLRRALVSILPFPKYQAELNKGKRFPISHFVPYGLSGYVPESWSAPVPMDKALKRLKAEKWKSTVWLENYLPDDEMRAIGKTICSDLKTIGGVPCEYRDITLQEFIANVQHNRNGMFFGKLMPHIPDTVQLLTFFRSDLNVSIFRLKVPQIDDLLEEARMFEGLEKRAEIFTRINRLVAENAVAIPLKYSGVQTHYIRKPFIMPQVTVVGPYFQRIAEVTLESRP